MSLQDLYDAETLADGCRVLKRLVPPWLPLTALLTAGATYYCSYRARLLLSKWKKHTRAKAIQRCLIDTALHESVEQTSQPVVGDSGSIPQDDMAHQQDPTAVTTDDLDEFHMSLGLKDGRDDDLVELVDRMLLQDPIPEGWVLYRTTHGLLRFRQVNTEELSFFHPGAHILGERVRALVTSRNLAEKDFNTIGSREPSVEPAAANHAPLTHLRQLDFSDASDASDSSNAAFDKLLGFFVDKEKEAAKILSEVEQSFRPQRASKRSTSRRTGVAAPIQVSQSLRVTTTAALQSLPPSAPLSPTSAAGTQQAPSTSARTLPPPLFPPKRPPTPRSSSGPATPRGPSSVTSSGATAEAPRVPSFRAPPRPTAVRTSSPTE